MQSNVVVSDPVGVSAPLRLSMNNSDLDNIGHMLAPDDDSVSEPVTTTASGEDVDDYLEPEDSVRHWYQNEGIYYT